MCTDVENDLVEELHRIAAKHERHNVPVNLAPQLVNVDIVRSTSRIAVLIEEVPSCIDISRPFFGRQSDLRLRFGGSIRLRHVEKRGQPSDTRKKQ